MKNVKLGDVSDFLDWFFESPHMTGFVGAMMVVGGSYLFAHSIALERKKEVEKLEVTEDA